MKGWLLWLVVAGLLAGLAVGCTAWPVTTADPPSVLEPGGPAAARIRDLSWFLFGLGGAVYVIVMGLLGWAAFRRRTPDTRPEAGTRFVVWGGIVIPALILLVVLGLTVATLRALTMPSEATALTIHVTGYQWWWRVEYPQHEAVTANEIHIPVGRPVEILLSAGDVIHNFWVPELHGKMDMIPGHTNRFWIQADKAGEYRGICAEFCGVQHAKMQFVVVAEPLAEFETWLAKQASPAAPPVDAVAQAGQQVFVAANCVYCHAIRGTDAAGQLGPDLTHLASRRRLGAGIIPNNRGNLSGWIVDPQHIKPGNLMPAAQLPGTDLNALLTYLETLE